jgi:aspartate aminotransferase-like enzyme
VATTAELEARLEALKKSRDTGALVVSHAGTSTTFRSLAEIERIIKALEAELAVNGSGIRTVRFLTGSGW